MHNIKDIKEKIQLPQKNLIRTFFIRTKNAILYKKQNFIHRLKIRNR